MKLPEKVRKLLGFLPLIGTVFTVDQMTKRYVEEDTRLSAPTNEVHMADGHIGLMRYHNPGMMLTLGKHKQNLVKLLSASITVVCCLIFVFTLGNHGKKLLQASLALLLGGAFSNTYDRMARGHVVDYVRFPHAPGKLKQVVFNIADFAIILGAFGAVCAEIADGQG